MLIYCREFNEINLLVVLSFRFLFFGLIESKKGNNFKTDRGYQTGIFSEIVTENVMLGILSGPIPFMKCILFFKEFHYL